MVGRKNGSKYPSLDLIAHALSSLHTAERDLRGAGLLKDADQILGIIASARKEFMVAWRQMLEAEDRWSEDESSQRAQMAMALVYLGDI